MIHHSKTELLKESLLEMIHLAEYSVKYTKTDRYKWGNYATGGILGYPSTVILFSVIDCLGSIYSGNESFKITIDDKERTIKKTSQHIYILNSKYFNLDLSQVDLENIYYNIRSTLTHNSILPEGYYLEIGENERLPINIAINNEDKRIYYVNVIPLFKVTKKAIEIMIDDLQSGKVDFENSKTNQDISKRDTKATLKSWLKK